MHLEKQLQAHFFQIGISNIRILIFIEEIFENLWYKFIAIECFIIVNI